LHKFVVIIFKITKKTRGQQQDVVGWMKTSNIFPNLFVSRGTLIQLGGV